MITIDDIKVVNNVIDLAELVEQAAYERGCELDPSTTYADAAGWFAEEACKAGNGQQKMEELAEILRAAEKRWYELEDSITVQTTHYTNFGVGTQPDVADSSGFIEYRDGFESTVPEDEWTEGERWIHRQKEAIRQWREQN